ncbi:MAG: DEAD/DEAH box helicase family protein [Candidatus Aenigmatarchaeota archaeon]
MVSLKGIEPREYQKNIAETASKKNTLVVLPTGMGKTLIALLVAIKRLNQYPESKILVMAPTRPLNAQHKKTFENFTDLKEEEIALVTGKVKPEKRGEIYEKSRVIIATPQTIENDLKAERIKLKDFSLAVFDESHRCVKEYSYTFVAKKYKEQAIHPLILGLTASPGGSFERIEEIKKNLFIEAVEIRSETDEDVKPYVKPIAKDWIYVELPDEMKMIKGLLEQMLKEPINWLKEHGFLTTTRPPRKLLLTLQNLITTKYMQGPKNYSLALAMMKLAEAIKIEHALELLETQEISSLADYLEKLNKSKKRVDKKIANDPRMKEVFKLVTNVIKSEAEHPKLTKLKFLVKDLLKENPRVKIIVFANYRATVEKINESLKKEGISSEILIGQANKKGKGMSQQEQIEVLRRFRDGEFNVLVTTSIGEEGLDIVAADYAIFYESVASEIRAIQRRGRVGRQTAGKVIFLLAKGTRDESYYWAAFQKEKKMKGILYDMREKSKKKVTLKDWLT